MSLDRPESGWIHAASVTGPFGITASVRDFAEVLDWQEHRRELTRGYYRLIHPPRVREFKARLEAKYPGFTAVLYVSGPLAEKEVAEYLAMKKRRDPAMSHAGQPEVLESGVFHVLHLEQRHLTAGAALVESAEDAAELHERNRRRGGSLSGRVVAAMLGESEPLVDPGEAGNCVGTLKRLEHAEHAMFYPSGMGAVTAVLDEALTADRPRLLVPGNVYRDTHLLLEEQKWAGREVRTVFLNTHDLEGLERRIGDADVAGVFVETVTNPLIEIPDLPAIASLCERAGKPLLVDNTMAGPLNATPLDLGATVVIHSTSKYLSGSNTHGGGVALTNDPDWADRLEAARNRYRNELSLLEYPPLWAGLRTFPERMPRFNRNGEALAAMLRTHPAVETVYYGNQGRPEWLRGLGSVVSCDLAGASLEKVAAFFDQPLPGVIKAPSLGSDRTLFCPYVLLAYYEKSEAYLRDSNLSKYLLRFAAGCEEEFDPVVRGISDALDRLG